MSKIKIIVTSISVEYDEDCEFNFPMAHYDLVKNGKVIGSSLVKLSKLEADKCVSYIEDTIKKIEKEVNK